MRNNHKTDKRSVSANKKVQNNKEQTNKNENPEAIKEFQRGVDFINSLVHEYLLKREYNKTLEVFQEELNSKLKNKLYYSTKVSDIINESVLEGYFNSGKKAEFFRIWNRLIPTHIKQREPTLEKLDFFLQIYFAVYPILPNVVVDKKVNFYINIKIYI
jgi:hypothetical protein